MKLIWLVNYNSANTNFKPILINNNFTPYRFFCFFIFVFLSCERTDTNIKTGLKNQILHLGNGAEPQTLDPQLSTAVGDGRIIDGLMEGLLNSHPKTLVPIPGVAKSWSISEDLLEITFNLRDNAYWSNGDRVTSHDFIYSYERMLTPELGAQYSYMLYVIKNAKEYNMGKIKDFTQVGLKAPNDTTLIINLESPTPYILELINHGSWLPIHPGTIKKFNAKTNRGTHWTKPKYYVSNGAFILDEWRVNARIVLKKNPNYWDSDNVQLNEVRFYPIESADSEERAFRAGYIHDTQTVPLHRIDYYKNQQNGPLRLDTYLGVYYYRFNVTKPPLDDFRIRKALSYAVNRKDLVEHILKAGQVPAYSFTPHGTGDISFGNFYNYDINLSKQLIEEYLDDNDLDKLPIIELKYNTSESHQKVAEAIQNMWKSSLGLDVVLDNQEWKVFLSTTQQLDYEIARAGWIGDYNDPNTFLDMWVTNGGNNQTGWSNTKYDDLIVLASKELDKNKRMNYFNQCEQILADEMPVLPIYFYVNQSLTDESLKGWYGNVLDKHPLKFVYLGE